MARRITAGLISKVIENAKSFDKVLKGVNITKFENGICNAEFKVKEEHCNILGGLHGGYSATVVDVISSYAFCSTADDGETPNVSVNINLTYLKGAKVGDDVVVESYVEKAGKSLMFLHCVLKDKKTGDILVKGSHTKFLLRGAKK